jgi:hypothetical protein
MSNQSSVEEPGERIHPLNDAAIAREIAEGLKARGMDPNLAYANTDDEWLADFGGPEAFRTN